MHQSSLEKNYFDLNKEHSFDSFNVAFALLDVTTLEPMQDIEKFAKLRVEQEIIENGDFLNANLTNLETHPCTQQEKE